MVGYRQTNQKTDTGKTLTRWPVFVDHFSLRGRSAKGGLTHTRAVRGIDGDVKLNRALWVMAETLLEQL